MADNDNNPLTFEEASRGSKSEDTGEDYAPEDNSEYDEESVQEATDNIKTIMESAVSGDSTDTTQEDSEWRDTIDRRVERETNTNIDFGDNNLDGLKEQLEGVTDNQEILKLIAEFLSSIAELMRVNSKANVDTLAAIEQLRDFQRPLRQVTVSGVNVIDDANTVESIVPGSSSGAVQTKMLMIRASPDNDVPVYIGDNAVEPDNGFVLRRGEYVVVNFDLRYGELYCAAEQENQALQLMGVA